jgi:predicted nucleic acid-binding protein
MAAGAGVTQGRQFVDTNVLVYAYDASAGEKHRQAQALLVALWESRDGCLSTQVLAEFYVTVTRKIARPLSSEDAAQIVADLTTWRVHAPSPEDVLQAITLHQRAGVAFWDALILHSAARLGCEVVWTEDLNAGQNYAGVRAANPFAILGAADESG